MAALLTVSRCCRRSQIRRFSTALRGLERAGPGGRSSVSGLTVTIFGATGFVGRYVVNRMGRMGSQIVLPFRCDEHDTRHLRVMGDLGQIYFRPYHLLDIDRIRDLVKYSNVVVNLVGRDYETSNFSYYDLHVLGAARIAQACKDMEVERLVHFSAYNASYSSPSPFMVSKKQGEDTVREIFPDVTILKPSDIYGLEDRFLMYYAGISKYIKIVPLIKMGKHVHKIPIFVSDVASAVEKCVVDRDTMGRTYYLCGPEKYLYYDLVDYIFRCVNRPFRPFSIPQSIFNIFGLMNELWPFYRYVTRDKITRMTLSEDFHTDKLGIKDLGVEATKFSDVAVRFLRHYRKFEGSVDPIDEIGPLHKAKA
ncbi:NADH dehydrogenase [Oopsacas minuta]|uniref:NADH dehydrogenase [ubiquinone] 1 alpha subcomplex subunit 9, mitochondrial n=1 Tax=Oopsacas minuta TaxID=111878 RepID=A0AAV7K6C9_9METZ|nr:NADH dehydrogenase [Oopsacas minuta]